MQIRQLNTWTLVLLLILSTCLLVTFARGRGGGGRGGGSRGGSSSRSRSYPSRNYPSRSYPTSRPAPRPAPAPPPQPRPSPRPASAPKPSPRPAPAPRPSPRPQPASPRPKPVETVVTKQPAVNPNFRENNPNVGSADNRQPASNPNFRENNPNAGSADNRQPAYNPNYKPDGAPPPYAPAGQPVPNVPGGPPPPYQPNQNFGSQGGQRPPYPPPGQQPPQPGLQPPPYPGQPGRPPAYPGLPNAPLPAQPGYPGGYPRQPGYPGAYPQQPGYPGGYPQQPGGYPGGYPQQPGMNRPYPVQPGYPQQPGMNRPYPVQPGVYNNRPYPQQPLGGNVWRPQSGMPAPAYMNYGGIPTGTNMYSKPHKQKGFLGSLMSMGGSKQKSHKSNKYYGSYPSPYGVGGMGHMGGGGFGHMGGGGGFLGKHGKSAAMYTILPYMAYKAAPKFSRPRFGFMPMFIPMPHFHHHHYGYGYNGYGHGMYPGHTHYYDVYDNDYVGKCQKPIKRNHTEIRCQSTYKEISCDAKCETGYKFPENITLVSNKCWHMTGVWRPKKNFPVCSPVCDEGCQNGGECLFPGKCGCQPEYRGDRCQFRKSNFLNCDARVITKGSNVGWVCNHKKNETECKIRCKEGEFETPTPEVFKCTPEGVWTPDTLPKCVLKDKQDAEKSSTNK